MSVKVCYFVNAMIMSGVESLAVTVQDSTQEHAGRLLCAWRSSGAVMCIAFFFFFLPD